MSRIMVEKKEGRGGRERERDSLAWFPVVIYGISLQWLLASVLGSSEDERMNGWMSMGCSSPPQAARY